MSTIERRAHRLSVLWQHLVPQHALASLMHRFARARSRALRNLSIRWFVRHYGVDMSTALDGDPERYEHFNAFFTRALRADARPMCSSPSSLVSPVDGRVGQVGEIGDGLLLQAKGQCYRVEDLLAGESATEFLGGQFATLYLSPRDYHRVHMPLTGELHRMHYVPGRLFSVNQAAVRFVPRLFARNERVICSFRTELGLMALILVGAIFVGGLETVWHGAITPPRGKPINRRYVGSEALTLVRGAEMGRFNMGSTVILLLPSRSITWEPSLCEGATIEMGQRIGSIRSA